MNDAFNLHLTINVETRPKTLPSCGASMENTIVRLKPY